MIGDSGERIAKAQDDPMALRRRPIESAVGAQLGSQIHHVILTNRVRGSDRRRWVRLKTLQVGETGLLLESADPRAGMQHQFRYLKVGIGFHCTEIAKRTLHIKGQVAETRRRLVCESNAKKPGGGCGESDRVLFSPIIGNVDQFAEGLTVIAGFSIRDGRGCAEHVSRRRARVVEHQSYGVYCLRGGKFVLDPCLLSSW